MALLPELRNRSLSYSGISLHQRLQSMAKGLMETSALDRELCEGADIFRETHPMACWIYSMYLLRIHRHPLQLGLIVTMGFFDGIYIPSIYLPKPSAFDCAFFWVPDSELTTSTELLDIDGASRMSMFDGEDVRVRVEADEFHDDEPGPPKMTEGVQAKQEPRRAPYQIIVRFPHWRFSINHMILKRQ